MINAQDRYIKCISTYIHQYRFIRGYKLIYTYNDAIKDAYLVAYDNAEVKPVTVRILITLI